MARLIDLHNRLSKTTGRYYAAWRYPVARLTLIMSIVILVVLVQEASAAKRKVIFQLANLRQWSELEYTYDGSSYERNTADRDSQSHEFEEKYHLEIDYAILGRRLANGSLELDFGLNQNYESERGTINRNSSSNGFNLEYAFDMLMFERRFHPVTLYSSRIQERVNAPFSKDYDLTSSHFSTGLALVNQYLPVQLKYNYNETETDGLDLDRWQSSEDLRLNAYLETGGFSTTEFQAKTGSRQSEIDGPAPDTGTDSYSLETRNVLDWKALSQRQMLHSSYRMQRDSGTSELRSEQWDERLRLRFGKALESGFSTGYSKTETPQQFRRQKEGEWWIGHQLFKSVTSHFQHNYSRTDFNTGAEDSWSRQFNLSYSKRLPQDCRVRLAYSYSYGEIDRNLDSRYLYVGGGTAEQLEIDVFLEVTLENIDILPESIVVYDSAGFEVPAGSYSVEPFGRLTKLNFAGSGLGAGEEITVEYLYLVNNSIEYSTTLNALSASLDLWNQKVRIYTNLSRTDQDLISGEATVSPLVQQTYTQVGLEANLENFSAGGNYSYLDSTISTEEYVEAFLSYQREKKKSVLNLRLTERFSSIIQNEGLSGPSSEKIEKNSLMLNVDYRRQLIRNTTLTLKGLLADIRGEGSTQDELSLGMLLESRWYKFLLRINADISWQIDDDSTTRAEQISFAIRRYF